MNHSLFWDLVRKDLALYRGMILMALAVGAISIFAITRGNTMFYLGSVAALCAFVILIIFLVQFGVLTERKERVHFFVLSLPITGWQYTLAKLVALSIAFFVPFLLTSAASLTLMAVHPPSRGFVPFATTVLAYFPLYFAVLISVTAGSKSDGPNVTAIIFFNIALNLLIPGLLRIPSVAATIRGTEVVWTAELLWIIALEIGVGALAVVWMLRRQQKQTDYL